MSPEEFLKEFGHLAKTEGGVGQLRQAVLQLASTGNLVCQEVEDEPAGLVLERIDRERSEWITDGRIKKTSQPTPPNRVTKAPPDSWKVVSLSRVCHVVTDGDHQPPPKAERGIPFLVIGNLRGGLLSLDGTRFVSPSYYESLDWTRRPSEGDLLYTVTGSFGTPVLVDRSDPFCVQRHIAILKPSSHIEPRFLLHVLAAPRVLEQAVACATGTAQKTVPLSGLRRFSILLPPLPEQKRIVEKVDQLMALCDELEAKQQQKRQKAVSLNKAALSAVVHAPDKSKLKSSWSRVQDHFEVLYELPENVKELRQAILQLAVMGKLVRQEEGDEPASELLHRIASRRPDRKKRSSTRQANGDDINPERRLPSGWAWASFPDLGEFGRGKSKHRPRNDPKLFSGGTYPVVQTGDVAQASPFVTTYRSKYNDFGLSQSKLWPKGTMCITIAANIADTGILSFDACFPDSVVGFVPDEELGGSSYFEFFVRTAKDRLEDYAPATAQKNINLTILEEVEIPVPPLAEQRRIIERVGLFMTLCDELEVNLSQHRSQGQRLMQAVVEGLVA